MSTLSANGAARDTGEAPDLIPVAGSHIPAAAGATTVRSEVGSAASEVWPEPAGIGLAVRRHGSAGPPRAPADPTGRGNALPEPWST